MPAPLLPELAAPSLFTIFERAALPERFQAALPQGPPLSLLEWTERYRRIGQQPLRPSAWPWLRDLYSLGVETPIAWVQKSSQVGISEWMVSTALWVADQQLGGRGNVLYVFPTQTAMDDFAQARVDKAVEDSDYLRGRVASTTYAGKSSVAKVRLKRIGDGHVYLRGSDNQVSLKTADVDAVLYDEVDEFRSEVIPTAEQRLNSSLLWTGTHRGLQRGGSTPTYPGAGIAPIWAKTTRRRYFLRCEACGRRDYLRFPDHVTRQGCLVCSHCGHDLDRLSEGEWVAEAPAADAEGYHVWRAYSPRTNLAELADTGYRVLEGLISNTDAVQQFHNQQLGVPHAPAGGSLTDEILTACLRRYGHPSSTVEGPITMGVDVGGLLHYWIEGPAEDETEQVGARRLLEAGTTRDWDELDRLWGRYGVHLCVIDAQPEGEKSRLFCQRHRGRAFRCFFPNMAGWKHADLAVWDTSEWIVQAHRTNALDALMDRFYQQRLLLPRDADDIPGLLDQLKAPQRILTEDADGRKVARYDEGNHADHFCLAACYAGLAAHRAAPRWGQASLSTGTYGFAAGQQPDLPKGTQVISRRKHKFFNEPGVDPFAAGRAQAAEEQDAARLAREALRLARKHGIRDEGDEDG